MSETVMVYLLSLIGTLAGTFGGILTANRLTNYRILQLEKKVDKHNGLIDRMYRCEQHNGLLDEQIKVANHRIQDLEKREEHNGQN